MTFSLKYPHDRVPGYVLLTDGKGNPFVPDRRPTGNIVADAMKYAGAFLALARRIAERNEIEGDKP
jgi:hypothetical protein